VIASTHIVAGLIVGLATMHVTESRPGRVALGFFLGVVSHMILDAIPHADYGVLPPATVAWIVLGEVVAMSAIGWRLVRHRVRPRSANALVPAMLGAVLPDAKFVAQLVLPRREADVVRLYGDRFHGLFHAAPMTHHVLGQVTQVTTTLVLLLVLSRFPRTR
jgi:membrane-bound metal-dependent hydrolase YbcI (DUF457 family)